jgi:hypothetical protein
MLKRASLILMASLLSPLPLAAQELTTWGEAGGWNVMVDSSLGNGCLIQTSFTDGSVVRIGIDAAQGAGYVTAFNENWGDIEVGAMYPISFDVDGEMYEGQAKGIWLNDVPGADIYFDNEDFMFDLAARQTLTLYHDGTEVMAIDLTGTMAGLEEVLVCQDAQN